MQVPSPLRPLARTIGRRLFGYILPGRRVYDPSTTGTYRLDREFVVPNGQNIFDPAVFGVYDLASEIVMSKAEAPDKQPLNLDICCKQTQIHRRQSARTLDADRNHVALRSLERGTGICLDACSPRPVPIVKQTIQQLGYTYKAIDISPAVPEVQREDLQQLSFADNTIAQILSVDTLEHVPDYKLGLREMHRVLMPEGLAVIHLPIYYFDKPEGEPIRPGVDPWEHTRYFSAREVIAAAIAAGFILMRAQFCLDYGALVAVLAKPKPTAVGPAGA